MGGCFLLYVYSNQLCMVASFLLLIRVSFTWFCSLHFQSMTSPWQIYLKIFKMGYCFAEPFNCWNVMHLFFLYATWLSILILFFGKFNSFYMISLHTLNSQKLVVPSDTSKKKLHNCNIAMTYLKQADVPLVDTDGVVVVAEDVASGDKELTLSILWNIFVHLQVLCVLSCA